jgi:hypothetical protein
MKQFLKKDELQLVNGGYLSTKDDKPVGNIQFVTAQRNAEYIMTFAKLAKDKNFKEVKIDSIGALKQEVIDFLDKSKPTKFVESPKEVKRPTTDKLASEALAFMDFQVGSNKTDKINNFLQQFTILSDFEEFGLFFEDEVVKLNELYTMKQIIEAVTETIDLLD